MITFSHSSLTYTLHIRNTEKGRIENILGTTFIFHIHKKRTAISRTHRSLLHHHSHRHTPTYWQNREGRNEKRSIEGDRVREVNIRRGWGYSGENLTGLSPEKHYQSPSFIAHRRKTQTSSKNPHWNQFYFWIDFCNIFTSSWFILLLFCFGLIGHQSSLLIWEFKSYSS